MKTLGQRYSATLRLGTAVDALSVVRHGTDAVGYFGSAEIPCGWELLGYFGIIALRPVKTQQPHCKGEKATSRTEDKNDNP